jgi:1,4-alpha-glucan branching enzyme
MSTPESPEEPRKPRKQQKLQQAQSGGASESPAAKRVQPTAKGERPEADGKPAAGSGFVPSVDGGDMLAIVGGYHGAPHEVLGPHLVEVEGVEQVSIRAFRPLDVRVAVVDLVSGAQTPMERIDPNGFYEARFPAQSKLFPYRLLVGDAAGESFELEDPYRFPFLLTDFDLHLFNEGNFFGCYEKLGAHFRTLSETVQAGTPAKKGKVATAEAVRDKQEVALEVRGVNFAVWAPNAERVSVIGPFNGWDNRTHALSRRNQSGVWEIFIPNLVEGTHYKYAVKSMVGGYEVDKFDPYGYYGEMRPSTDARIWDIDKYEWNDCEWMAQRAETQSIDSPIAIYEVHLGSWKRSPEDKGFLNYRQLAHELVDYVKWIGYTHIELLPITEHPLDGSWGYQVTGYYAPTSRHGTPDDFKYFVDYCHQNGIGVILDWVPAHFPKDAHGLAYFDGTHLYEHADPRRGEHPDWGTKVFNYGRNEVRNFLLGNALFWIDKYHLDGFRVDAVASMLYLDFGRKAGEWLPNQYGGRENLEAIDFIRRFNELVYSHAPGVLTIAEESTAWPMVTRPTYTGGLGFSLKWNMGWMHDMLNYMKKDPLYRRYHQGQISFSLMYAFSENFVLPFSHDEVVHLKRSMVDKMPGDEWQKFANLRVLYGYMYGHPGKKLLFMGGEFGQWQEWSEARSLDWHLTLGDFHWKLQRWVSALNHHYVHQPALHEVDNSWEGFEWIDLSDVDNSVISFVRRAKDPSDEVVFICNFTPQPRMGYRMGLPAPGHYTELLNSDWLEFGGSGVGNAGGVDTQELRWQNSEWSGLVNLPPLGVVLLKRVDEGDGAEEN